jgi:site-specific DNA-cytosine methylase
MQFLKPKYIYMENVLDILKFADAKLARYGLSRLVAMHYQAKLGIMAAGCYGLPQFRMRVFLLGCHPKEASNISPILGSYFLLFVLSLLLYFCPVEFAPISSAYS